MIVSASLDPSAAASPQAIALAVVIIATVVSLLTQQHNKSRDTQ